MAWLLVAALWAFGAPTAGAQTPEGGRVVEGRLVNGTDGGSGLSGLTVVLHMESMTLHEDLETATDPEGRFRFDAIEYDPQTLYGVSVRYQGALYGSDLDLSAGDPPPVSLTAYEAVTDETALSVSKASLLLAQVDTVGQMLYALEIVNIKNDTDRTYVPGAEPMSLLRFGLPAAARDLQVDTLLMGADVLQVDRGFALTAPVPPGEHEVMFSYRFPYTGSGAVLSRSLPYGAESVRVLAPYGLVAVASEQLDGPEIVTIGDISYALLRGSDMSRGSRISVELAGLPQASLGERVTGRLGDVRLEYAAPLALGSLMISLIGFTVWRRVATRRAGAALTDVEALEDERGRLIREIAELDQRLEEGEVSEEQHRLRRATLAAGLASLPRRRVSPPG